MRKTLCFLSILLLVISCELNSQQEMALNNDLQTLMDARNEGDALMYLGLTHPQIIRFYKNKGDAAVKSRFQQVPQNSKSVYGYYNFDGDAFMWSKYFQQGVKKELDHIQVKFLIRGDFIESEKDSSFFLYALSSDDGNSWTFAEEQDYFNDSMGLSRLFPKN
jgi:hypothetical protein